MSSGGGGQSGQTRYDWNDVIGSYWGGRPDATGRNGGGVLGWATDIAMGDPNDPLTKQWGSYRPFGVSKNADGTDMAYNDPRNIGQSRVQGFNTDQYTAMQRIRDQSDAGGPTETQTGRAAAQLAASGGLRNAYSGDNPYFQDMVKNANADTATAYKNGTSADLTRLMNMSGAFGGSAHLNALANNEAGLAKQLGNQTTSMYGQQYDRSAGLDESRLGRQMQAIPLTYQAQDLSNNLNDRLMNVGSMGQQQGQKQMDDQYGRWTEAANWGRNNASWLAQLIGGAQGSTGIQTQFGGYAPTNYGSTAAGLGLLGASLFGGGR